MNMNMNMNMSMNMGGIVNNPSTCANGNVGAVLRRSGGIVNPFVPLPIVQEHESGAVVYPSGVGGGLIVVIIVVIIDG